jgi:phenylalanyl-tRNA synthetase alpha chain
MNYQTDIDDILSTLKTSLEGSSDIASIKLEYLGRKGKINSLMSKIKDVPETERKSFGEKVNDTKLKVEELILKAEVEGQEHRGSQGRNRMAQRYVLRRACYGGR